ncbi:hypothetical protein OROGR_019438 [Orobanche gracilis]
MKCRFSDNSDREAGMITFDGKVVHGSTFFRYLGSIIQKDGELDGDVAHRIKAGWLKWKSATGVLCDPDMPHRLKGKFYRTAIRPALLYGTECWAVKQYHVQKMNVAEMRMLRWMCGHTKKDRLRNEVIREKVRVASIEGKMMENRLRWHIVGLCGPPGSGKSTLASRVSARVNELWAQRSSCFDSQVESPEVAVVLPMDGFHLYRHQLEAMKDPKEAHARRGSPWTFDPERLLRCLTNLRNEGSAYAPSFDHSVGDPVEDDIFVSLQHKLVIVEGNYLLLDEDVWRDISYVFDEKWFIDVDIEKAMQRVLRRHVSTGKPTDVAKWRIDYNDRPNAELIIKSSKNADLIIKSVDISM